MYLSILIITCVITSGHTVWFVRAITENRQLQAFANLYTYIIGFGIYKCVTKVMCISITFNKSILYFWPNLQSN